MQRETVGIAFAKTFGLPTEGLSSVRVVADGPGPLRLVAEYALQRMPTTAAASCACPLQAAVGAACNGQARNGHHRRWALKRCTDALVATGTPPSIAARSAQAMAALAQQLAQGAAAWGPRP